MGKLHDYWKKAKAEAQKNGVDTNALFRLDFGSALDKLETTLGKYKPDKITAEDKVKISRDLTALRTVWKQYHGIINAAIKETRGKPNRAQAKWSSVASKLNILREHASSALRARGFTPSQIDLPICSIS
jgi:hypothetical protein